jgi:hypothetical protein
MASSAYYFFMTPEEIVAWIEEQRVKRGLFVVLEHYWPTWFQVVAPDEPLAPLQPPGCAYLCATQPAADELHVGPPSRFAYPGECAVVCLEPSSDAVLYLMRLTSAWTAGGGTLYRSLRGTLRRRLATGVLACGLNGEPGLRHNDLHYSPGAVAALAKGTVWKQPGTRGEFRPATD